MAFLAVSPGLVMQPFFVYCDDIGYSDGGFIMVVLLALDDESGVLFQD